MASDEAALRDELKRIEELIAQARGSATDIHQELGGREEGAIDSNEISELFTRTHEQEAVLGELELRRDDVRRRLGMEVQ